MNKRVLQSGDCISDVLALVPVVEQIVSDVEAENLSAVISDIESAIPQVESAISSCSSSLMTKITTRRLQSVSCLTDILALVPTVEGIASDISSGDYTDAITAVESAIPQVESAISACASEFSSKIFQGIRANNGSISVCINDVVGFASTNLPALVNDIQSGNVEQAIQDITADIPTVEQIISDCSSALANALSTPINKSAKKAHRKLQSVSCMEDILSAIPIIEQTIADVEAKNFSAIISDISSIVSLVPNVISTCESELKASINQGLNGVSTIEACINDVTNDVPALEQLVNDIESGNALNIISDIANLVPDVEQLITDCSSAMIGSFGKGLLKTADPATCWTDSYGSAVDIYQAVEALIAKNTTTGVVDIINAVSAITGAIGSCYGVNVGDLLEYIYANVLTTAQMICASDAISLAVDGDQLYNDIKTNPNFNTIFADVSTLIGAAQSAYTDCEPVIAQIISDL